MLLNRNYAILLFFALNTSFAFFLDNDAKNILLISLMAISPFLLLFSKIKEDSMFLSFIFFLLVLLVVNLIHINQFRISSYAYTAGFVFSFVYLKQTLQKKIWNESVFLKFVSFLIYIYAVFLIVQQFCVLFGLPVINLFLHNQVSIWKLNSLTPEPSHLVRFMFFFMVAFLELKEIERGKKYVLQNMIEDKWIWLSYFWVMFTCGSTTGFVLVLLIFLRFINVKTLIVYVFLLSGIVGSLTFFLSSNIVFERVFLFGEALLSLDFTQMDMVDHSAAHRIAPFFVFIEKWNPLLPEFWIGYGMDYGKSVCQKFMFDVSRDMVYANSATNVGGLMAFILDNGFCVLAALAWATWTVLRYVKNKSIVFIWIFLALVSGINTQMYWSSLFLLFSVSFFKNKVTKG